jgi:AraC-like DNA-binding protein
VDGYALAAAGVPTVRRKVPVPVEDGSQGVRRQRLQTDDPDVARGHIRALYAEHDVRLHAGVDRFRFATDVLVVDEVSIAHVQYAMGADIDVRDGVAFPVVMHQRPGARFQIDHRRRGTVLGDDDVAVVPPGHPYGVRWETMDTTAVGLSPRLLAEDAALLLGHEHGPVTFALDGTPDRVARGHWLQVQRFVARNLANVRVAGSVAARRELLRMLSSATLACFPNSTSATDPSPGTGATPEAVRRAVAHIEEHAANPLGLEDLSEVARLGPRALQAAFRRHLGTTPLGHLRSVRLDRAHRELGAARPGDGQSVATIATAWGFTQPGRFAREHRERYGSSPSETLRSA